MAKCPFATFEPISGGLGAYSGGPFKIVHHTTEGSTYASAKAAYRSNRSDPHFTVVGSDVFQHIDTASTARSLKNAPGGVQTNRDSAVQIEVVGFAGQPKDVTTLQTVATLCRWIESEHQVPQVWPNGRPRSSSNGRDPGGHNRSATNWDAQGGHYGHSQVPENDHWDPGYTAAELAIVTPSAQFDPHDELATPTAAAAPLASARADAQEAAETIVRRILVGLMDAEQAAPAASFSRATVRVASAGMEVEVTVERAAPDAMVPARKRKRISKKRPGRSRRSR